MSDAETESQLWSVAIGLAKLQGDQNQIDRRFVSAFNALHRFDSTIENKMMAAEIVTALDPSQWSANADLQGLSETLAGLESQLRHKAHVPKELSVGIAAVMMFGRDYAGNYPIDRFVEFSKITKSYESAAILSIVAVPVDQLSHKFDLFRAIFGAMGYETSEDTELASAYLSVSDLGPEDVRTKLTIIVDALKNYLEYPLVAASILSSIPTLEAHETLDLMEKACSMLGSVAPGLGRSKLVTLAVLMIHGIRNEVVRGLDPTAKISNTPVQFTYFPMNGFFLYYYIFVVHSSYYSRFSGIGGFHPAHVHGVGGFMG